MKFPVKNYIGLFLVLILIAGGIVSESLIEVEEEKVKSEWGLLVFIVLLLGGLFYVIIPKTKLAKYIKMNETVFIGINVLGIVSGGLGLLSIFVFDPILVRSALWKLIMLPYSLFWIYVAIIMRIKKTSEIYDEKQNYDMTQGAGITLGVMIYLMCVIISPLIHSGILSGSLLLPCYIFATIFFFSIITLMMFKMN